MVRHNKFNKDLGSTLNGLITLVILGLVLKLLGDVSMNKTIIAFIASTVSYPLAGITLRSLGIWKY